MTEFNFYSVKGGQGCSTTAAAFATHLSKNAYVALIDMAPTPELSAVFGCSKIEGEAINVAASLMLYEANTPMGWTGAQHIVYDWGTNPVTNPDGLHLLVTRPCYLALRRYAENEPKCDGVVLINEEGRALRAEDVEAVIKVQVLTEIEADPLIARAVDAGLLTSSIRSLAPAFNRLELYAQQATS